MRRRLAHLAPVVPAIGLAIVAASWSLPEEPGARRPVTKTSPAPAAPAPPGTGAPAPLVAPSPPRRAPADDRLAQARPHLVALRRLCRTPAERAAVDAVERALRPAPAPPSAAPAAPSPPRPTAPDARLTQGLSQATSADPGERALATARLALRASTADGRAALERLLEDPDAAVRAGAARALTVNRVASDLLLLRLEREEDPGARAALLSGLERRGADVLEALTALGHRTGWRDDLAASVRRLSARAGLPEPPGLPAAPPRHHLPPGVAPPAPVPVPAFAHPRRR